MIKEKHKNIIIIVLLCIIILLIGIIAGVLLNKKMTKETLNENVEEVKELTTEEVLSNIIGEWGTCHGEYECYGLIVGKTNDEYYYTPYLMWSEFGDKGTIEKTEKIADNKYKLTVHYPGYEDAEGSAPERNDEYSIDISEVSNDILYIDDNKYQKVKGDRETFFESIMS